MTEAERRPVSSCRIARNASLAVAQITTDAHSPYLRAVEDAFGADCDYAQLHKIYGASNEPEHGAIVRRHASAVT